MPGYLNKEKVKLEKDPEIIKQCVEEQRKWFESLLYERKEIEVSDIWNKKEYGWLDFEGAGKIIK